MADDHTLNGRTFLITGGASGIGKACAHALIELGGHVVILDADEQAGESVAGELKSADFFAVNIADYDALSDLFRGPALDGIKLDGAVNAAGIEGTQAAVDLIETTEWNAVIGVNLTGVWHCMRQEIATMRAQRSAGAIVNIASVGGLVGIERYAAYCASKHGVVGLTKAAALDVARYGIRVNAVCPGFVDTPMVDRVTQGMDAARAELIRKHPMKRFACAEEVARLVLWLLSDAASFVTGQAIAVDGGYTAR